MVFALFQSHLRMLFLTPFYSHSVSSSRGSSRHLLESLVSQAHLQGPISHYHSDSQLPDLMEKPTRDYQLLEIYNYLLESADQARSVASSS